jgi:methylated-DNA-[protein]-cysteine S-methyltransferase
LTFDHPSAAAAAAALDPELVASAKVGDTWDWLAARLQDFAAGRAVSFDDVPIDLGGVTAFERRVVKQCRAIRYGHTRSYGELAALAGSPRAARAVGNAMAGNQFAIVVPCHRVINSDGSLGNYGARGGRQTKRRLLDLEHAASAPRMAARRGLRRASGR